MLCLCISEAALSNAGEKCSENTCLFQLPDVSIHRDSFHPEYIECICPSCCCEFGTSIHKKKGLFQGYLLNIFCHTQVCSLQICISLDLFLNHLVYTPAIPVQSAELTQEQPLRILPLLPEFSWSEFESFENFSVLKCIDTPEGNERNACISFVLKLSR